MWHDNETTQDYLNFGVVADACANMLRQTGKEPISIGVSGGWGAGKSSLVKMISSRLTNDEALDNRFVVVTFNPWLYQDFDSARSALLQIVGDEIVKLSESNKTIAAKVKELWSRINALRLAQYGGEVALTLTTGIPVGTIGASIQKWLGFSKGGVSEGIDADELIPDTDGLLRPKEQFSMPAQIQAFRDTLERILSDLNITLVVFVDDLDRCLPKTAISTLESIRLLLFLPGCAFVVAADNDFIKAAVKVHFDGAGISEDVATNYFDKLIQIPLKVPPLGVNEAKAYLVLLLLERESRVGNFDADLFAAAAEKIPQRLKNSWRGDTINQEFLYELVENKSELTELMDLAEGLATLLHGSSAVSANPRLMKRFLNTVYLRDALSKPQGIELDIAALAKWHLLERCDEKLAEDIAGRVLSENDGRVDTLRIAEEEVKSGSKPSAPFEDTPFVRQWLQLPPLLGEVDLRPILHLSRDSGTRDFGEDNLTPQARELRDALQQLTRAADPSLKRLMQEVGSNQTGLALERAWQLTSHSRTWKSAGDVRMLIECCKTFPDLKDKSLSLLSQAPVKNIGAGLIPMLGKQQWAIEMLKDWHSEDSLMKSTRNAIEQELKGYSK